MIEKEALICISTPDGITNGDIMRKVFPDFDISEYFDDVCLCGWINGTYKHYWYHRKWWDAPYRPKKKSDLIFMNKDILNKDKENVLNKIRAEIEQMDFDFGDFYDHTETIIEMVLKIIDKYKEQSEAEK